MIGLRRPTIAGRPRIPAAVLRATIACLLLPAAATAQDIPGPTFRDVLSLHRAGSVAISPDGGTIAYTVTRADWEENRYDTEIWLAPVDGPPFQLTRTTDGGSSSPAWSPDGRLLGFLADRGEKSQVHLIRPTGGEAWALTAVEEGVSGFAWSPDGRRMALRIQEPPSERSKAIDEAYGDFTVEDAEYRNAHLWSVEVGEDGGASEPERLTEGDFHVADFAWSPDGSRIAVVRQPTSQLLSFMESDLWVLEMASGELRELVVGPGPDASPVWSPDGEWILFAEYRGDPGSLFHRNGKLARVPAAGGEPEVLTGGFDEDPCCASWSGTGIRFVAGQGTARTLFSLDPASGEIRAVDLPEPVLWSHDVTEDGMSLAVTAEGPGSLVEVFRGTMAGDGSPPVFEKRTDLTAQTAGWAAGSRRVIRWQSEDGTEIEGVLYEPDGYDPERRYPLLVQIHGGPTGTSRPELAPGYVYPILQWLAKGALVLQPNYRGSAGYGEAFRGLNVRNLGVGDMWDVMSGVDHLVEAGLAHPDSLGAMGWSQGGYISAFLTTNTDAFRAISVGAGISDWMTYYVNTDIHPFTRQYLKATPWEDPEIYAVTSPITNIRQASTPTLIQHGEFDRRVPIPNAYELYQGLQDQGVETKLIVYEGFGHGITKPKERLAATWHNWAWFAEHVWGEEVELPVEAEAEEAEAEAAETAAAGASEGGEAAAAGEGGTG